MDEQAGDQDLLRGAEAISEELYQPKTPKEKKQAVRKLYHQRNQLPIFTLPGSTLLLAFRSRLWDYLRAQSDAQEQQNAVALAAKAVEQRRPRGRRVRNPQQGKLYRGRAAAGDRG